MCPPPSLGLTPKPMICSWAGRWFSFPFSVQPTNTSILDISPGLTHAQAPL